MQGFNYVSFRAQLSLSELGTTLHGPFTAIRALFHFRFTQSSAEAKRNQRLPQCQIETDVYLSEAFNMNLVKEVS